MNKEEQIYNQIRDSFIDIEINKKSSEYVNNKYDLSKYYEIGRLISFEILQPVAAKLSWSHYQELLSLKE